MSRPYLFKEEINYENYFHWPKSMFEKDWREMPSSSKAIFPVIACHCDKNGKAFPGRKTIAALSGLTERTVTEGLKGLVKYPWIQITNKPNKRGQRKYIYHFKTQDKEIFPFHRCILEGGNWSQCTPSAKALYPVMRCYGFIPDMDQLEMLDHWNEYNLADGDEFLKAYVKRKLDYCNAEMDVLAEYSGISVRSVYPALKELEECSLIAHVPEGELELDEDDNEPAKWKIYLHPPESFSRDYLNKQLQKSKL